MLSHSVNSNIKPDKRKRLDKRLAAETKDLPMSLAHLNDSIGYENPHILTHAKTGLKVKDLSHAKVELKHVVHHAQQLQAHNKKLTKKLSMIPSVKEQFKRLSNEG